MPVPAVSGAFSDILDPRFQRIFHESLTQLPDMLSQLFNFEPNNGRNNMQFSGVGAFGDWSEFSGKVNYDSVTQEFDTTLTPLEFASGFQVERKLMDDDQYNIMDQRPAGLARAATRTRQKHGARIFNNAFSVDSYFYNNTEGVALCSNSHTTNAQGVSTGTGFDNLVTTALSATALATVRIQMVKFVDDRGNKFSVVPNELLIPPDLYEVGYEIVASMGKVDVATNNRNVHEGAYRVIEWDYLTDTNNWFVMDDSTRKAFLHWLDRIPIEFAFAEDLDTILGKWRGYMRYGNAWDNWRFINGASVS